MAKLGAVEAARSISGFVDRWIAFQRWYRQIPSVAVGLAVGDEVVLASGHGLADVERGVPATPTTRYRIASHSKVFTATAIMQLVEQGRMRLDDRVADHLDWFRTDDPSGAAGELAHVTVRQLLSHSSGLTRDGLTTHWYDDRFPTLDELVGQVATMPVLGTVEGLKYSNIAYTLAGHVVEAVTGRPYEEHVVETLLDPLGLAATTPDLPADLNEHAVGYSRWLPGREREAFDHVPAGSMNSATGFSSNVVDLLRWYRAHRIGSGELLDDRSKREMQRVQFEGNATRWGIGFQLAKHGGLDVVSHGGGYPGFITYSGLAPDQGVALVVLTNAIDGNARVLFDGIATLLGRALDGDFAGEPGFDVEAADSIAGFYEDRWSLTQVGRIGSRVVIGAPTLENPNAGLMVLDHVDGLTFRYPDTFPVASPGELVRFEPGEPPRMLAPSSPPVERSDGLVG